MNAVVQAQDKHVAALFKAEEHAQYLTFMLGGEVFAIRILAIREIISYGGLTEVPMMPPSIKGVINLRGAVVPVVDLAVRFNRPSGDITKRTCIVIVEMENAGEQQVIGVIVDAVNAVLEIPAADIEPSPSFGAKIRTDFIAGMAKVNGRFIILLDIDKVLSMEELGALSEAAARPASDQE